MSERIALYIPTMAGGGAERVIANLAGGLSDLGYAVDLLLVRAEGPYLSEVPEGVRIINFDKPQPRSTLGDLVRYLRREQPVALLSALDNANVVAVCAKRLARVKTRSVVSVHNMMSIHFQKNQSFRSRYIQFFMSKLYSWADAVIAVSGGVADDLAKITGLSRALIQVIYNPIVSADLLRKAQEPVSHPWFAPGEQPVVLSAGRLNPQKHFATLLRAFAQVRAKRAVRLMILGEGKERGSLETLALELGIADNVSLEGFASNPFAFMSHSALFVMSSQFEGFGNVLVEALACGCPVVSTDCPSGPSEILAGGRWGRLAPVGDVGALASAMEASLAAERVSPPPASWAPYEIGVVTREYAQMLLPE